MSCGILVDSVRSGLDDVISKHFTVPPNIEISEGSDTGDGYSSKTYSINLKGPGKTIDLFVKYLPVREYSQEGLFDAYKRMYTNEHRFYRDIYPSMLKFQKDRNIDHPFTNVSNYFCTNVKDSEPSPVFLENIKLKGYQLRDRKKPIDEQHIALALTTHARYHAVSFAMKDQDPELFKKLSSGLGDLLTESFRKFDMDKLVSRSVDDLKESIDPVKDKKLFDRLHNLSENLLEHCANLDKQVDEYAAICLGDCWSNNMMFLYDNNTGNPLDIKLCDFQLTRLNSPVVDVSYFFYTVANKRVLNNFDNYMKLYYGILSKQIKVLGSDPEKLYPESIFKQHWQKLSKFGFAMSFLIVKALLFENDEVPNFVDSQDVDPLMFSAKIKKQDTYIEIIKDLLEHFIDRDFL